jgi:micrococcal nuclease
MMSKRRVLVLVLGAGALVAGLAAGCIGTRSDDFPASSFTARAAEAARVVRVIDGDTYIVLSGSSTYRLRLLGVDASEHD